MKLQKFTKVIETFLDDEINAMGTLYSFYTDLPEADKPTFVAALIGNLVIQKQLREHQEGKPHANLA